MSVLFDIFFGKRRTSVKNNQGQNIADAVITFVNEKINKEFTARELRVFVLGAVDGSAPGSPDRILRMLRQQGKINYVLVNRNKSLYKGLPGLEVGTGIAQ